MTKSVLNGSSYSLVRILRTYGPLCMVLLVAAFLRIYQLGTESLWYDEAVSREFANLGDSLQFVEQSKTDNNFPTYYLLLHYWVWLLGAVFSSGRRGSRFSWRSWSVPRS